MTSIRERDYFVQKNQVSKTPISLLSNRFNNRDHKDPLKSNKSEPSKALTRLEAFAESLQTLPSAP